MFRSAAGFLLNTHVLKAGIASTSYQATRGGAYRVTHKQDEQQLGLTWDLVSAFTAQQCAEIN